MKRKTIFLGCIIATSIVLTSCSNNEEVTEEQATTTEVEETTVETINLNVNTEESKLHWKGEMLGMYSHEGDIKLKEGSLTLENGNIKSGKFVVDMTTIQPTDENYDEEKTPEKLVGHLSSPDFFDVENFPTASFEITSVEGNVVKGNLTVRGKTNEETINNVVINEENGNYTITGNLTFDRQKYDVSYTVTMKDMILSDDISLDITLKASKQ